jgi:hypothetical protein
MSRYFSERKVSILSELLVPNETVDLLSALCKEKRYE